ncbi:hypothetical protein CROQUDRAFT_659185 [Cronartium quercuum f. sp. fusiforme G11]|uniref:Ribosomal RNA-processing protein 40 n=1 Tax=Cronartium quercuum f. sp. fusiforme G11 TaxID=708437 RepID=A0A9P6TAX6_9BASI|nr:hypothetical protein CROQUDRAFT_659185 [Cronartium quercuum f. sp. fusiforme G11]
MNPPKVVLPGDLIHHPITSTISTLTLGPGLRQIPTNPTLSKDPSSKVPRSAVTRAGLLGSQTTQRPSPAQRQWVEGNGKRYVPALGEPVIGIIISRQADGYKVDIGSSLTARLDAFAFESATKRSKPNLKVGTVVYGRISLALPFIEPELECVDPTTMKANGFGEMSGGYLIRDLDLRHSRSLLSPPQALLAKLGQQIPYEISIGLNGRIWLKSNSITHTIYLVNQITQSLSSSS